MSKATQPKTSHLTMLDDADIVDLGFKIHEKIQQAQEELALIKEELRTRADSQQGSGNEKVILEGSEGEVHVYYPKDKIKIPSSRYTEVETLKEELPTFVFNALFAEKTVYEPKEEFYSLIPDLEDSSRTRVAKVVDRSQRTPQVHFKDKENS